MSENVNTLVYMLQAGDWQTMSDSIDAAQMVAQLRTAIFTERNEVTRQAAAGALGALAELGVAGAVPVLIDVLNAPHRSYARDIAAFCLLGCGDSKAEAALIAAIGQVNSPAHLAAVRALAEVGDPRALKPLIAIINDSRMATRHELVRLLGVFDDVRVVFPLLRLLHHTDTRVMAAARDVLNNFHEKYAYGMLIEHLVHVDYTVRRQAAIALGEIGAVRAVRPLLRMLDAESDERVCQAMLDALDKLGYATASQTG